MNTTSTCPGAASLQDYLLGSMSEATAAAVEEHLALCPECRRLLPTIQAEDDFTADFRAQARQPQPANALLDRLAGDLRGRLLRDLPTSQDATPAADGEATPAPAGPASEDAEDLHSLLAPPREPDELGRLGDYRVLKVLGSGGMGVVFLAEDMRLRRRVALKAMKPALAANARARQRFLREAQLAASLTHDHVVAIHHVGEEKGVPFLVMPLLQGESLDERLKREGRLPTAEVLRIGLEAAEGLAAAHERGLIHRDVKPANLWLEAMPGGRSRVKVLDFGLARAGDGDAQLTQSGVIVGTPAYMAPEQARGEKVDARSDLFSLGCVLYKLCIGKTPFAGDTTMALLTALSLHTPRPVRDLNPEIPAELSDMVMRMLAKAPSDRPQSAGEVIQAIRAIEQALAREVHPGLETALFVSSIGDKSVPGSPVSAAARAAPRRRRRLPLVLAAVVLLAGLIGVGVLAALIRIPTPHGDYVIDTDDPDFFFQVRDGAVKLEDRKNNKTYTLKVVHQDKDAKEVEMEVNDGGDLVFKTKTFTIKRGEKAVVTAWFERKPIVSGNQPPPGGDERKAAVWVLSVGGSVVALSPGKHVGWITTVKELPEPPWKLDRIDLQNNREVSDDELARLEGLTNLTWLDLSGDKRVTDAGMKHLQGQTDLQVLLLEGTQVSDAGLAHLKPLSNITEIDLSRTKVTDAGLKQLKALPNLTTLFLSAQVSDAGLDDLMALSNLEDLGLFGTRVTNDGLARLKSMPKLKFLALGPEVDAAKLERLKTLTNLRTLYLEKSLVRDADLEPLKGLTNLNNLNLRYTFVGDAGLALLKTLPNLKTLDLHGTRVSDAGLQQLQSLPNLHDLQLAETKVSDEGLTHLRLLTTLNQLNLTGTKATEAGVDTLRKALPNCNIEFEGALK